MLNKQERQRESERTGAVKKSNTSVRERRGKDDCDTHDQTDQPTPKLGGKRMSTFREKSPFKEKKFSTFEQS